MKKNQEKTIETDVFDLDIPTYFWLGAEGLEPMTKEEFDERREDELRDELARRGTAAEQVPGG